MWRRGVVSTFAAALLLGACSKGSGPSSAGAAEDAEAAWMDEAAVIVDEDPCAGRETVTLVDTPSGHSQVMSDESFAPEAGACGQAVAAAPVTAEQVLVVGASLWK